jgi:hypothetical protein
MMTRHLVIITRHVIIITRHIIIIIRHITAHDHHHSTSRKITPKTLHSVEPSEQQEEEVYSKQKR